MFKFKNLNELSILLLGLFIFLICLIIWISGLGAGLVLICCAISAPIITKNIVDPIVELWREHGKSRCISYYARIREAVRRYRTPKNDS